MALLPFPVLTDLKKTYKKNVYGHGRMRDRQSIVNLQTEIGRF